MKYNELQGLSEEELLQKVDQLKKDLMQFRFQAKTGKLETGSNLSAKRKDIARVLTALNQSKASAKS